MQHAWPDRSLLKDLTCYGFACDSCCRDDHEGHAQALIVSFILTCLRCGFVRRKQNGMNMDEM